MTLVFYLYTHVLKIIVFLGNRSWTKEFCSNLLFRVNLGLLTLSFVVDKAKWVQLNGQTLQVLKISLELSCKTRKNVSSKNSRSRKTQKFQIYITRDTIRFDNWYLTKSICLESYDTHIITVIIIQDLRSNIKDKTGKTIFFKLSFRYVTKYYCWNK